VEQEVEHEEVVEEEEEEEEEHEEHEEVVVEEEEEEEEDDARRGSKRVYVITDTTAAASTRKTSSKKRRVQSVLTSSKKGKGQGEGTGRQSSQYRGVAWEKSNNKWKANIKYNGKRHHLGCFEDEKEAARAYDKPARVQHGLKAQLNFPTKKEQAAEEAKQQRWIKCGEAPSKYRGVNWYKRINKWVAQIGYDGKQYHLGYFEEEEEQAARAYDRAARVQHGEKAQLNFPAEGESGSRKSSKYRGVSWCKRDNKWRPQIRYDGKKHNLGYFEDEEEAANAYERAAKVHKGEGVTFKEPVESR
jgi:hypothetical protein